MKKDLDDWMDSWYSKPQLTTELQVEVLVVLVQGCLDIMHIWPSLLACCTNCPPNHLDLFACSLGSLRHQFYASRMSFEQLNSLQLSEYVISIWFDLFSLINNIWAILSYSGDTKLFNGIYDKVPLHQYSIQLLWGECLACLFW